MAARYSRVEFRVVLPAIVTREGRGVYVANCPLLDVVTQGDTEDEAKKNLAEALSLFLISCYERGTLENVLRRAGFTPGRGTTPTRVPIEAPYYPMEVSLPFAFPQVLANA